MLKPGDRFDRYIVEGVLGEGGMGVVYRARDTRLERRVALKLVRAAPAVDQEDNRAAERLVREARAAAALHHPNAVAIFDVGEVDGTAFIAMELVGGRTLRSVVGDASVPWRQRVRWLVDVGRALEAAHKAGIVHRDVKPENVMVGEDASIKVLDFGIARRAAPAGDAVDVGAPTQGMLPTLTAEGVKLGTPLYMAPEQMRGDAVDGRSDQFAWGVLGYELLAGRLPWRQPGDPLRLVAAILTEKPDELGRVAPALPPALDGVVQRALAKDPADRFPTMGDAARALDACLTEGPGAPATTLAAPESPAPRLDPRRYSDAEMAEILDRALRRTPSDDGGFGLRTVLDAAVEVGIPEGAVRRAAAELDVERNEAGLDAQIRKRKRHQLIRHFVAYAMVNLFLLVTVGWRASKWVLFGWGIGIALQVAGYLFPDPARLKREREKQRGRRGGRKEGRATPAINQGVEALLDTAARVRVASGASDRQRVRVEDAPSVVEAASSPRARKRAGER